MPKVSVIIPIYNVEKYLARCLDSVLAQTFTDFELILIDDGSPDNCPAMCDEWAKKDDRIVVIHQENGGLSAARNAGIDWVFSNSDSEWITFIDSDDWIHPDYLAYLYEGATTFDTDVSYCKYIETDGDISVSDTAQNQICVLSPEESFVKDPTNAIIAAAKLYKKACFKDIRYPIGKIHEDQFTTYKILFKTDRIAYIDAPLYFYYINNEGITKSNWSVKRLDELEAFFEQTEFFHKNDYTQAEAIACAIYLYFFRYHINKLYESNIDTLEKERKRKVFASQLRKFLRKRRRVYSLETKPWHYEFAFPREVYIYWTAKGIISKIKSIWRKICLK